MAPHPDGPTDTACSRGLGSRLTVRATGRPLLPWPDRQPLSEATERPPSGGLFVWACELVHTPIASAGLKASDRTLPHARKNAPAEPSSDHIPLGGFARSTQTPRPSSNVDLYPSPSRAVFARSLLPSPSSCGWMRMGLGIKP
jgi:hypothetical protein